MGANISSRAAGCFAPHPTEDNFLSDHDRDHQGLGHSFCYVRPDSVSTPTNAFGPDIHTLGTADAVIGGGGSCRVIVQRADHDSWDSCGRHHETSFKSISGASVSANTSTPRTMASFNHMVAGFEDDQRAAAFEGTSSFNSLPLQPVPRNNNYYAPTAAAGLSQSGPIMGGGGGGTCQQGIPVAFDRAFLSGPIERGFMSGPMERGFLSGPLERGCVSAPIPTAAAAACGANHNAGGGGGGGGVAYLKRSRTSLAHLVKKALSKSLTFKARKHNSTKLLHNTATTTITSTITKDLDGSAPNETPLVVVDDDDDDDVDDVDEERNSLPRNSDGDGDVSSSASGLSWDGAAHNLQWAQGKAGEDRVHVVLSEDHGWLFVGIYDGFSGPDAPDFLMSNLYREVYKQLRGLLWDRKESAAIDMPTTHGDASRLLDSKSNSQQCCHEKDDDDDDGNECRHEKDDDDEDDDVNEQGIRNSCKNVNGDIGMHSSFWENLHQQRLKSVGCNDDGSPNGDHLDPHQFPQDVSDCRSDSCDGNSTNDDPSVLTCLKCGNSDSTISKGIPNPHKLHGENTLFLGKVQHIKKKKKKKKKKTCLAAQDKEPPSPDVDRRSNTRHGTWLVKKVATDHFAVLKALENALELTERSYLQMAEHSMKEMPELALMGSCVLVMLMKGADVYVMNVGDSRAILAQVKHNQDDDMPKCHKISKCSNVPSTYDPERIGGRDSQLRQEPAFECPHACMSTKPPPTSMLLSALQLSSDHSTNIKEEVLRIKAEHPDDGTSILNDRVKGRLKVTRAFGAGFLKTPRWNNLLLEVFRVDYVGNNPYVTCKPALHHYSLGPNDRFLVLSSDGLYQYLSNEEVVSQVEWFMENYPDGDPAQYLIEELLFRAAKKAGMDFHELLDIPQGDRRNYHDDVCVMIISLEGRIWRSFG